jgi:hypothetical protein
MPETTTPSPSLPATLEVGGSMRLAGNLSLLTGTSLRLSSARLLDDSGAAGNFTMPEDKNATLNLGALRDAEGYIDNVDVTVSGASGTTLNLEFRNLAGVLEQRCLQLVPGYEDEDETQNKDELSGEAVEDNFQLFKQQSIRLLEKLLKNFLIELSNHLRDRAATPKKEPSGENNHYEAFHAINKSATDIIAPPQKQLKNITWI